jgi:prepilin-type N-terminal cleavage/methylation domain-containing protein
MILDIGLRILDWETAKARRPMQMTRRATIQNSQSKIQNGFTLVEMLTVIGIIVLLVSILLPVVSAVRIKGQTADTAAMLARIASGIQSYYGDFNAYPGPLHNGQIYNGGIPVNITGLTDTQQITQAENLVLGLLGGLVPDNAGGLRYDPNAIGNGPVSLNPRAPKKYRAYMDKVSLSAGDYGDEIVAPKDCKDSPIPEFVDRYPDPMPILYMRANVGAGGICSDRKPIGQQEQYDLKQIEAYTTSKIGVGKEAPSDSDFFPLLPANTPQVDKLKHGLQKVDNPNGSAVQGVAGTTYHYPYDLYGFLRHPSMTKVPRQKDGFILISSGPDRIYGTKDDVINPPTR